MRKRNHHILKKIFIAFLVLFCAGTTICSSVFAASEGGNNNGGGYGSCGSSWPFCTYDIGATWRWYEAKEDRITIESGWNGNWRWYLQGGEIINCKKYGGGYWRYAMVNAWDNKQYGLLGISGNSPNGFNSSKLGGGTMYRGSEYGEADWDYVKQIYERWAKKHGELTRGFERGSNLSWFCASDKLSYTFTVNYELHYLHKDCFGRVIEEYTQKVTDGPKDPEGDEEIVSIRSRIPDYLNQGYSLNGWSGDYDSLRPGAADDPNIRADVSDRDKTITYYLEKSDEEKECDQDCVKWAPSLFLSSTPERAFTQSRIGVRNMSLEGKEWYDWHHENAPQTDLKEGPVYAKPTDYVQWKYCYYPGVEKAAHTIITPNINGPIDQPHAEQLIVPLYNKEFHTLAGADWEEGYYAWQTDWHPFYASEKNTDCHDTVPLGIDYIPLVGTLPGCKFASQKTSVEETNADPSSSGRAYTVKPSHGNVLLDPGNTLWGYIDREKGYTYANRTNGGMHQWSCLPYPCGTVEHPSTCYRTCKHDDNFYTGTANTSTDASDKADVIVPYNFLNTASATIINASDDVLYSGETVDVADPKVTVNIRKNEETDGIQRPNGYATQVPNAKAQVIAFLSDPHDITDSAHPYRWATGAAIKTDAASGANPVNSITDFGEPISNGTIWQGTDPCKAVLSKGRNGSSSSGDGVCKIVDEFKGDTLNEDGNMDGIDYHFTLSREAPIGSNDDEAIMDTYDVFDEAAGNYFCVAVAVYPFSVMGNKREGLYNDNSWYISEPSCKKIAKRPSFQVWGAGIYSAGHIDLFDSLTEKTNVLDGNAIWNSFNQDHYAMNSKYSGLGWTPKGNQSSTVFYGSWGELSATIQGSAERFASGASMGYWSPFNTGPTLDSPMGVGDPGGTQKNRTDCLRSPLTIANSDCHIGYADTGVVRDSILEDVNALTQRFETLSSVDGSVELRPDSSTIGNVEVPSGETWVSIYSGDITINGPITYLYPADGYYSNLYDIPKYIIYAKNGNINIDCKVEHIDAVLIADGTVNTCGSGSETASSPADALGNSHQLVINGAVVTGNMILNRTFGANTGGNSIVPAELINYDSTLYLWANRVASAGESGQLTEAATQELAPRY